jgi:two-component system phosphate regulon sensor histidine kinase PhoR
MASIDAGTVQLDQQQIAPNTIIEKVISSLNIMLEKKNGQLHLELLEAPHNIQADSMHFFNIVYNLVDNAIKYNEGQPVIHIRSRITDSGWQLSVQDNGIGMNMAVQKQVFQRFYRQHADDIHDVKGFGLGLTYVKRMMDAHQGQVHITSQVNQGSTFQLTFPNYYFEQYV